MMRLLHSHMEGGRRNRGLAVQTSIPAMPGYETRLWQGWGDWGCIEASPVDVRRIVVG